MPTINLGQVRPVYRGAWNSVDTYSAYDFVIYNGSAYLALKDVPANYEPPSQTEYWVLFGAKGEPGADGEDGAQGERGPSPAYRWDGTFLSIQNPDGTFPDQGVNLQGPAVPLSNSVTSTSETDAASSKAVNTAYEHGTLAYNRGTEALNEARQKVSKTLNDATGTLPLANGGTGRTDGQCPAAQALLLNGTLGGIQSKFLWSVQNAVTYLLGANPEGTDLYPILPNKVVVGEATVSSICKGVFAFAGYPPHYLPSSGTWKGFTATGDGTLLFCETKSGGDVVTHRAKPRQYGLYVRTA